VSGFGRIGLVAVLLAGGLGIAGLRAQTVLGDPRDAARTFASNCSACHKSPQGLAKSGQVAGFLRQHYTTGPEMSAAMAAYLVAAGSAPAAKKGGAIESAAAAKSKGKKQEQLAAHPSGERASEALEQRTLRGKQRAAKSQDEAPAPHLAPQPPAEEAKQPAATAALSAAPIEAAAAAPPPIVLDIPMPPLPEALPPDLTQSAFTSSPLP